MLMFTSIVILSVFIFLSVLGTGTTSGEAGVQLEHQDPNRTVEINPISQVELEFGFTLTNTGDQNDSFELSVITPVTTGTYKYWSITFQDRNSERVRLMSIPGDLPDHEEEELGPNESVDIILYVLVYGDEDAGLYDFIRIHATSEADDQREDYLAFHLTVIRPNLRVSNDPGFFSISPGSGIREGDSIDIILRVFNDGTDDSGMFYVLFYNGKSESDNDVEGNTIATAQVGSIQPGSYFDVVATWENVPAGENDIFAYADKPIRIGEFRTWVGDSFGVSGLVVETIGNDNSASIAWQHQDEIDLRPDLSITGIHFDGNEGGTTTHAWVSIENNGRAKALQGSATVSLKIGGTSLKGEPFNNINPYIPEEIPIGGELNMEFIWKVPNFDDELVVKATVDHPEDPQSNNDRLTRSVEIFKAEEEEENFFEGNGVYALMGVLIAVAVVLSRPSRMDPL